MNQFIAFTKKELWESVATFRLYILLAVFALLGVMGPLMALLTPAILESLATGDTGITIILPEPTYVDAWVQFFSGFAQMGTLALAVIFSGIMGSEFSKGTLINLLTKGLKRHTVILSKFFSAGVLWTGAIIISVGVAYVYTAIYFETEPIPHFVLVFGAPWLFGLFMITLLILGGTLFGNLYGSLAVGLGTFFTLLILNIIPAVERFNPVSLSSGTLAIIMGTSEASDFIPAVIVCTISIIVLVIGAIIIFNKKKV